MAKVDELRAMLVQAIETVKGELAGDRRRVQQELESLSEEADAVRMSAEERIKFVRKYQPGTIEELRQHLEAAHAAIAKGDAERKALSTELEKAELENKRLSSESGLLSRVEL